MMSYLEWGLVVFFFGGGTPDLRDIIYRWPPYTNNQIYSELKQTRLVICFYKNSVHVCEQFVCSKCLSFPSLFILKKTVP